MIVIGGGASGLTAAITSKDYGCDVAILESTDRVGKKILATGNGRCNISNEHANSTRYHSNNVDFFTNIIDNFSSYDAVNFFSSLGLHFKTLENNKMYPMSLQSSSVVDVLKMAITDRNIPIHINSKVKKIEKLNLGFKIFTEEEAFQCEKLILCTGGKSYPKTGSDGSGYKLAKDLGHTITELIPSIVQIKLNYGKLKALSGVKFEGSTEIFINDKSIQKEYGEVLFTDYGISGPTILQLSRIASYNTTGKKKDVKIVVDMIPDMSLKELKSFLDNHLSTFGYRSLHDCFIGVINKKLIVPLLNESGVKDIHQLAFETTWKEKSNIVNLLKSWSFQVIGTNGFNDAQVTAGGINTKDVNPLTLESTIIKNLYFSGEALDVDGDCGGFNLHWCWASGIRAGQCASSK